MVSDFVYPILLRAILRGLKGRYSHSHCEDFEAQKGYMIQSHLPEIRKART